jgi:uncharacterized protein
MIKTVLKAFVLCLLLNAAVLADDFGQKDTGQTSMVQSLKAYALYKMGDYAEAHALWAPLAEQGNTTAMINIANLYVQNYGESVSREEALKWLERARDLNDERALEMLETFPKE